MGVGLYSVAPSSITANLFPLSSGFITLDKRNCEPVAVSPRSMRSPNPRPGLRFCPPIVAGKRGASIAVVVGASPENTGEGGAEYDSRPEAIDEEEELENLLPTNELEVDAKLLSKLEKKLKMKVAKNVRLRRKKLLHKRRLRKKGRWPPSKTKKSANV